MTPELSTATPNEFALWLARELEDDYTPRTSVYGRTVTFTSNMGGCIACDHACTSYTAYLDGSISSGGFEIKYSVRRGSPEELFAALLTDLAPYSLLTAETAVRS